MKHRIALRQSEQSVRVLAVATPIMWAFALWVRHGALIGGAIALTIGLLLDILNARRMRRKAQGDPSYLDRRVKGT